jgi:phospholipid/cholesterol/gamma-HCH transport system substrate-binding protein
VNTIAPPISRILTMVAFAASCIGLLLVLWLSFGGTIPLQPQGYRLVVEFPQAVQLGAEADVRIAGVSIGRVSSVGLDRHTGLTRAILQIDPRFSPRPSDTRAILRQKSLLGETYVELSPGSRRAPMLHDDARLPEAQVAPTVELDQILSTFDPATRRAFETWMQDDGMAFTHRGQDFNAALAELFPFATNVDRVLGVLRRDQTATSVLLRDGGQVFGALARSPAELQGFVRNSNAVFATTAERNRALAAAIRAFPGFLVATRLTIDRLDRFAAGAKPLIDELRPAAVQLSPALERAVAVAPELRDLLTYVGPLTSASRAGVPAIRSFLNATVPWLGRLRPYLGGLVPVIDYVNSYRRELAAFFANGAATTQAASLNITQTKELHYLRISNPVNPEVLAAYPHRIDSARTNPYLVPGGFSELTQSLPVFGGYLCSGAPQPTISPTVGAHLLQILQNTYFTATPGGPPCHGQPPLSSATTGGTASFPHLQSLR